MDTARFDFDLPPQFIAQHPLSERDASRLLVLDRCGRTWRDQNIRDLPQLLRAGDLLVFNDTKVVPARLRAVRTGTGGKVEIFLLPPEHHERTAGDDGKAVRRALTRSGGKLQLGEKLELANGVTATLLERLGEAGDRLGFSVTPEELAAYCDAQGEVPLPPYIQRPEGPSTPEDRARYQTVYAQAPGAVAAPTAGLHFTPQLLAALELKGVQRATVTLHVGLGTFRTVKAARVEDHHMDPETYVVGAAAAEAVTRAKAEGRRVVAVGSTATRTLEACWDPAEKRLRAGSGQTALYLKPPHDFHVCDAILTNFHLPKSSLLMLVAAFAAPGREDGLAFVLEAYEHAKRSGYRFFSYGDACLFE